MATRMSMGSMALIEIVKIISIAHSRLQAIPAFNLCVQGGMGSKVSLYIADYAEKIKMMAV